MKQEMNHPHKPTSSMRYLDWQNRNCCTYRHYKVRENIMADDTCKLEADYSAEIFLGSPLLTAFQNDIMFSEPKCKKWEDWSEE